MVIAGLGKQGFWLAWIHTIRLQHSFPCLSQISPELHASLTHYRRCGQASAWLIDANCNSVQTRSNSGFSLDYTGICLRVASKKVPTVTCLSFHLLSLCRLPPICNFS